MTPLIVSVPVLFHDTFPEAQIIYILKTKSVKEKIRNLECRKPVTKVYEV